MKRLIVGACAAGLSVLCAVGPTPIAARDARTQPMRFELRSEPAAKPAAKPDCTPPCQGWISAVGAITPETPRDFEAFIRRNDIRTATVALDSDGGSVLGALALGRAIRALGMNTTVDRADGRRASCESMCAFVLLAGVERSVPADASVLVHQIWLGDRRDDPTAAKYSAEDLVLVQRDIGRLAQYTVEMGGGISLLETALRIPPWEPMRLLSRSELRSMKMVTRDEGVDPEPAPAVVAPVLASGPRAMAGERSWVLTENAGHPVIVRKHPLTVEGDDIGAFEIRLACGASAQDYMVSYSEQRRATRPDAPPEAATDILVSLGGRSVTLAITQVRRTGRGEEISVTASGMLPAALVGTFSEARARSMMIETTSADTSTAVRVGNAGLARNFPQFAAQCGAAGAIAQGRPARAELRREAEAMPRP